MDTQAKETKEVDFYFLDVFADAWNRHDVDAIIFAMTPDCVFEASMGPDIKGARHVGREQVRAAVEAVFEQFPELVGVARSTSSRVTEASPNGSSPVPVPMALGSRFRDVTCSRFATGRSP
jgi:hypothetical protein